MKAPRQLNAEEIEVRVKKLSEKGAVALLYKTARVDMDILDETYGPDNWTNDYEEIKGNLYCRIGVRESPDQPFVYKQDCGIESREDEEGNQKKGEASDAFKRAGFRWGIGRELYSAPFVFITADKMEIKKRDRGDSYFSYDRLSVSEIEYDGNTKISRVVIRNDTRNADAFSWKKGQKATAKPKETKDAAQSEPAAPPALVCSNCHHVITDIGNRTPEQYRDGCVEKYRSLLCKTCIAKLYGSAKK